MLTVHVVVLPVSFPAILLDGVLHLSFPVGLAVLPLSCVDPAVLVALFSDAVLASCPELACVYFIINFLEDPLSLELVVKEFPFVVG